MAEDTERVKAPIGTRPEEIRQEAAGLERALKALAPEQRPRRGHRPGTATEARRAGAVPQREASPPARRRRAARGARREELLAAIKVSPGATTADLAATIGIRPTRVHALVAKAKAERQIVRNGDGYRPRGS